MSSAIGSDNHRYIIFNHNITSSRTRILAHAKSEAIARRELEKYALSAFSQWKTRHSAMSNKDRSCVPIPQEEEEEQVDEDELEGLLPPETEVDDDVFSHPEEAMERLAPGECTLVYDSQLGDCERLNEQESDDNDGETFGDLERINMVLRSTHDEDGDEYEIVQYWGIQRAGCTLEEYNAMETALSLLLKQDQESHKMYYNKNDEDDPTNSE